MLMCLNGIKKKLKLEYFLYPEPRKVILDSRDMKMLCTQSGTTVNATVIASILTVAEAKNMGEHLI